MLPVYSMDTGLAHEHRRLPPKAVLWGRVRVHGHAVRHRLGQQQRQRHVEILHEKGRGVHVKLLPDGPGTQPHSVRQLAYLTDEPHAPRRVRGHNLAPLL